MANMRPDYESLRKHIDERCEAAIKDLRDQAALVISIVEDQEAAMESLHGAGVPEMFKLADVAMVGVLDTRRIGHEEGRILHVDDLRVRIDGREIYASAPVRNQSDSTIRTPGRYHAFFFLVRAKEQ